MNPRIAILAALPREITPLIRDWPLRSRSREEGWMIAENDRAIAVCAGMGSKAVTRALELAESRGPIKLLLSVGYAGALRTGMTIHSLHWPATVIDDVSGERYYCEGGTGTLVTTESIAGPEEKMQLANRWNADLVDMEASTVARLARMRGLFFRTLRVVSDEVGEKLPDFNRFINKRGGIREAAFARYIMLHPWLIPTAIRLGKHAGQASETMGKALREFLEQAN